MTLIRARTCDYCGEPINENGHWVTIAVDFCHEEDQRLNADVGDYHFTREQPCYQQMSDAMLLAQELGGALAPIPVASNGSISQRRRRHVKPNPGGAS
jgi:hypothetical protein